MLLAYRIIKYNFDI